MGRFKAAFYDFQMGMAGKPLASLRQATVAAASGAVLELGVGTGQNLPFYPRGVQVVAIDPDPAFLRRAERRGQSSAASIHLILGAGEALPFADGTFDEVVATLVFCTVGSPPVSLSEVRRVLKPRGRLRFIEHVRSDDPRWARIQDLVTPVWKRLADGCCPNRTTLATIEAAGFNIDSVEWHAFGPPIIRPQVRGTATANG